LLQMRFVLAVLAVNFAAIPLGVAQAPNGFAQPSPRLYELYSWPQSGGTWNFCLLPSPSGVTIPVEVIFNKKSRLTGTDQLERKISLLPTGTRIIWMNGITAGQTPTKESSKLALPPSRIVEQVKRYAEQHGVQVLLSSQSTAQVLAAKFPICRTYQHLRARLHQLKETFGSQFTYFLVNDHTTCAGEPHNGFLNGKTCPGLAQRCWAADLGYSRCDRVSWLELHEMKQNRRRGHAAGA